MCEFCLEILLKGVVAVAHYVVRARLKPELAKELKTKLEAGEFRSLRPFGQELSAALEKARRDPKTSEAVWEEQCFCSPPLAMERKAVLDHYFEEISTEQVSQGEGWRRIEDLRSLWAQ